jgi:hypothetical protein
VTQDLSPEQLLELYKIAIDEYRFEVKLNWDRTVFYLTLNSGLIAIATGLLKVEGRSFMNLVVAGVFFIGLCISVIGIRSVRKGHDYYRRTIVKKTVLEDRLGLTKPSEPGGPTLAVGTTAGQDETMQILHNTEKWLSRPLRKSHITWALVAILFLFSAANIFGIVASIWLYDHPSSVQQPEPVIDTSFQGRTAPRPLVLAINPLVQSAAPEGK